MEKAGRTQQGVTVLPKEKERLRTFQAASDSMEVGGTRPVWGSEGAKGVAVTNLITATAV